MSTSGGAQGKAAIGAAWSQLKALPQPKLADLFAGDPDRPASLTRRIAWPVEPGSAAEAGMRVDFSKTHLSNDALAAFEALADASGFGAAREALFGGGIINVTEGRAATHGALRGSGTPAQIDEAEALLARMGMLVEAIHEGALGTPDAAIEIEARIGQHARHAEAPRDVDAEGQCQGNADPRRRPGDRRV